MSKGRNWSEDEVELFYTILVDPEFRFVQTVETRAFNKSLNKEVFETIQKEFKTALFDPSFVNTNTNDYSSKHYFLYLDVSIKKLQTKYSNIKKEWRKKNATIQSTFRTNTR